MYTIIDDDDNKLMVAEPSPDYVYTYADYLSWKFEERLELFRGKIFKMSAPNTDHQRILGKLFIKVAVFLENKKCQAFVAPFDVRLPVQNKKKDDEVTTVVQPDLCVVCDETKIDKRGCCGAPDIVVEILSPGNSKKEVHNKFELYQETGIQEYWIVEPVFEHIIIYSLHNGKYIGSKPYSAGEIITSPILPGLKIEVKDIFKN